MPRRAVLAFFFIVLATALPRVTHGAEVTKEYQLKAVLLFRLTQFVEWPTAAFATTNSPVVIGILGENPFGPAVEIAARGETAHGRPIVVRYFETAPQSADCHLLYIARSEAARAREIVRRLENRSILTVSDIEDFARTMGGMVRFLTEDNKIGMRINLDAATAAGLSIDARLLRMAQVFKK